MRQHTRQFMNHILAWKHLMMDHTVFKILWTFLPWSQRRHLPFQQHWQCNVFPVQITLWELSINNVKYLCTWFCVGILQTMNTSSSTFSLLWYQINSVKMYCLKNLLIHAFEAHLFQLRNKLSFNSFNMLSMWCKTVSSESGILAIFTASFLRTSCLIY